jgi:hypothetical protein
MDRQGRRDTPYRIGQTNTDWGVLVDIIEERGKDYGAASVNLQRTADLWSAYLGVPITVEEVCVCMSLVKISRMAAGRKTDNYVDARAYLTLAEELS